MPPPQPDCRSIDTRAGPRHRRPHASTDQVPRHRQLHRHARPEAGGERRGHAEAPAARQGRARHRQDHARRRGRPGHGHAAAAVAHQVHHQGAARPVRIRRGESPARQPAGRRARQGHPPLHRQGRAVAGLHRRPAGGAAHRRDRQGRHRVSERPAARDRPHGVLRLRNARVDQGQAPAGRVHHLQQREGTARRLPAPLLLPLHQVPRRRHDEGHHRCALPRPEERAADFGDEDLLRRAQPAGPEEEAVDLRTARLAQAARGRGHSARGACRARTTRSACRRWSVRC